jgi:Family of unknown function (DUF6599)
MKLGSTLVCILTLSLVLAQGACDRKGEESNLTDTEKNSGMPVPSCGAERKAGEVRFYTADNLHNYNNGAADLYIRNGFLGLATRDCRGPGKAVVVVELFDMGTAENAQIMFDYDRGEIAADLQLGDGGFFAGGSAEARSGRFLLRTMTLAAGADPAKNAVDIIKAGLVNIP